MTELWLNPDLTRNLFSQCLHHPWALGNQGSAEGEGRSREGMIGPAVWENSGAEIQGRDFLKYTAEQKWQVNRGSTGQKAQCGRLGSALTH